MKYYKVIVDNNTIGVGSTLDFCKYQAKHKILMTADETNVQFMLLKDKLYRDNWMKAILDAPLEFIFATINEIEENEYEGLKQAFETKMAIPEPVVPEETEEATEEYDADLEFVREMKLKELSNACKNAIIAGFDYGGEHYSLTIEDQMELTAQYENAKNGLGCQYHADGKNYRKYSIQEITEMYYLMVEHRMKCKFHFNELKQYVNSLSTLSEISAVNFDTEL